MHDLNPCWHIEVFSSRVALQFACRTIHFTLYNTQQIVLHLTLTLPIWGKMQVTAFFACNILITGISRSNQIPYLVCWAQGKT